MRNIVETKDRYVLVWPRWREANQFLPGSPERQSPRWQATVVFGDCDRFANIREHLVGWIVSARFFE